MAGGVAGVVRGAGVGVVVARSGGFVGPLVAAGGVDVLRRTIVDEVGGVGNVPPRNAASCSGFRTFLTTASKRARTGWGIGSEAYRRVMRSPANTRCADARASDSRFIPSWAIAR